MSLPVAFHNLPADHFPFVIEFIGLHSRVQHETITVDGPGAVRIPGMAEAGEPIATVLWFPNEEPLVTVPDDTPPEELPIYHQLLEEMRNAAANHRE
jgi:hypothetical protein